MKKQRFIQLLIALCLIVALIPVTAYAAEAGWVQNADGRYSYMDEKGRLAKDTIIYIDGAYYGFDADGYMYDGEMFRYNYNNLYYAQPGGVLLQEQWHAVYKEGSSEPTWYYFNHDKKAVTGQYSIDGNRYYFNNENEMCTDFVGQWYEYDITGKQSITYYYHGQNGIGVKLQDNAWTQVESGKWVYIAGGQLYNNRIATIGGQRYLFDTNGYLMAAGERAQFLDPETNQYHYFRSKGDGIPYTNEWYAEYDENGDATWYYYGEGGRGYIGYLPVGDKGYYLDHQNKMEKNTVHIGTSESYLVDENGIANKLNNNTWTLTSNNKWAYLKDSQLYRDCVVTIGGTRYLFDSNGYLAEEPTVGQFYDKDAAANYYFCTKTGGVVCVNEWAQPYLNDSSLTEAERNSWYYYGDSGRAAQGYTQLGSVAYYFGEDGEMLCNTTFEVEGYDENNHKVTDVYHCDENGIVTKTRISNWKQAGNGKWTYEKDGALLSNCIAEIDGATYAFDANGYMFDNEVFELSGTYYRAKAGGVLYTKGWYSERDANNTVTWYYYGEGGKISHGYTPIGTAAYYFGYDGKMITSTIVTDDNTGEIYHCAKNGVVTKINANGWTQVSYYDWYYFENGVQHTGWLDWNGSRFYMDENGLMVTGWLEFDGAWYYLKSDGRMAKGGWIGVGNLLYYLDENGVMQTGWLQYDGKWYYLSAGGTMSRGWINIGRTMYYFDDDGVMQTGWLKYEDEWYYLDEYGAKHTGWLLQDEIWYYMDVAGVMQTGIVTIDGQNHAFTFSGVWLGEVNLKSSWFNVDGTWVYFDENGDLTYGWLQLGDYWYAFNEYGHMITGFASDGVNFYYLDNSGVMQTGWELIDGYWHYFHENGVMHFGWLQLDGHWYAFNGDGQMLTGFVNDSSNSYYLAESGVMQTGWIQAEGYWFYAHENGALEYGWMELDGAKYYFDKYGRMLTGSQYINGYWYYFDNNGVLRN